MAGRGFADFMERHPGWGAPIVLMVATMILLFIRAVRKDKEAWM